MSKPGVIFLVEADLLPLFNVTYVDDAGAPIDVSPFTDIVLRVRRPDETAFERTAVIDDAVNGLFHFEWAAGDLVEGDSKAEIRFEDGTAKPETVPSDSPLVLRIRERV